MYDLPKGVVQVKNVDSGWGKPLIVQDVQLKESSKAESTVVAIKELSTSTTLWNLVRGKLSPLIYT